MMMSASELDPIDERFAPLAQAIGRVVLGAAAFEKVLLLSIAQRGAEREGLTEELGEQLSRLEAKPAGALLGTLRELGTDPDLADRIQDVIARRNRLVHGFVEDAEVMKAFTTGQGVEGLIARVDALAVDIQRLINEIAPAALSGAERAVGATPTDLLRMAKETDLSQVEDGLLRKQLAWAQALDVHQLESLRAPAGTPPD